MQDNTKSIYLYELNDENDIFPLWEYNNLMMTKNDTHPYNFNIVSTILHYHIFLARNADMISEGDDCSNYLFYFENK